MQRELIKRKCDVCGLVVTQGKMVVGGHIFDDWWQVIRLKMGYGFQNANCCSYECLLKFVKVKMEDEANEK